MPNKYITNSFFLCVCVLSMFVSFCLFILCVIIFNYQFAFIMILLLLLLVCLFLFIIWTMTMYNNNNNSYSLFLCLLFFWYTNFLFLVKQLTLSAYGVCVCVCSKRYRILCQFLHCLFNKLFSFYFNVYDKIIIMQFACLILTIDSIFFGYFYITFVQRNRSQWEKENICKFYEWLDHVFLFSLFSVCVSCLDHSLHSLFFFRLQLFLGEGQAWQEEGGGEEEDEKKYLYIKK